MAPAVRRVQIRLAKIFLNFSSTLDDLLMQARPPAFPKLFYKRCALKNKGIGFLTEVFVIFTVSTILTPAACSRPGESFMRYPIHRFS